MRKTLASVVVIVFAGLLCTSLLAVFSDSAMNNPYLSSLSSAHNLFLPY